MPCDPGSSKSGALVPTSRASDVPLMPMQKSDDRSSVLNVLQVKCTIVFLILVYKGIKNILIREERPISMQIEHNILLPIIIQFRR